MSAETILIDLGSSTVKVYSLSQGNLDLIRVKSISFKKNFSPENGISKENYEELVQILRDISKINPNSNIHVYATAIFRKFTPLALQKFSQQIIKDTGIEFECIDQELENEYLELALLGKYHTSKQIMFVNIGGGSTELVIIQNNKPIEKKNIDIGVGTINSEFPKLNEITAGHTQKEVVAYIQQFLPSIENKPEIAFNTGGELHWMQNAHYPTEKNTLFQDKDHPLIINLDKFIEKNDEVYYKIPLKELEKFIPENPTWTHGARAYNTFAQTICQKYGIKVIIPSDSNLINGVVRKHFT